MPRNSRMQPQADYPNGNPFVRPQEPAPSAFSEAMESVIVNKGGFAEPRRPNYRLLAPEDRGTMPSNPAIQSTREALLLDGIIKAAGMEVPQHGPGYPDARRSALKAAVDKLSQDRQDPFGDMSAEFDMEQQGFSLDDLENVDSINPNNTAQPRDMREFLQLHDPSRSERAPSELRDYRQALQDERGFSLRHQGDILRSKRPSFSERNEGALTNEEMKAYSGAAGKDEWMKDAEFSDIYRDTFRPRTTRPRR